MDSSSTGRLKTLLEPSAIKSPPDPFVEFVQDFECRPFTSIPSLRKKFEDRRIALENDKPVINT